MTTLCSSLRDFLLTIFAVIANSLYVPIAFFNCVKSLFITKQKKLIPKVVAITGANSGIGEGIAYAYAKSKVSLVLLARNQERLEKVAQACKELGSPDVKVVQLDVSDTKAVSEFFDTKTTDYEIDLFIANAGIATVAKTPLLDQAEKILQVNVLGAIAGINAVYKAMKKRGRGGQIAVVSSVCGFFNPPALLSYGASKVAVMSYCRDLRALGKDDGIAINTIAPGYIATAMTEGWSRKNTYYFLTPEYFGGKVKDALEHDVPLISLPLHQFFPFAIASSLTPAAKEWVSNLLHKYVDPVFLKKRSKKDNQPKTK